MGKLIGVQFQKNGKLYYFDANDFDVKPGDYLEFVNKSNNAVPSTMDIAIGRIAHLELEHKDIMNNMMTKEDLQAYIDESILGGEW